MPLNASLRTALAAALLFPVAAQAQERDPETPEILVTAQRRPEAIRTTPIAITALSGEFIAETRLDDVKDLITYSPGFSGNSDDSYIDGLAVRGIVSNDYGIGGDPAIGVFKDGVYQGRTGSVVTSLFDIERAETLRGPQGFLFGRNAISGAISLVTRKPVLGETGGYLQASLGETNRVEGEGAINLPLGDHAALRVAGYGIRADGWLDNAATPGNDRIMGQEKLAGRASLLFESGPLRVTLTGEYEWRHLDGTPYRGSNADREVLDTLDQALGTTIVIRGGARAVDTDLLDPRDDGEIASFTAQADWDLGFARLSAITGYRGHTFYYDEDYDYTALPLGIYRQRQSGSYASQELRLVSSGAGPLTWSLGASGYREKVRARFNDEADERFVCLAGYGYASCDDLTQDLYGTAYSPTPDGMIVQVNDARNTSTGLSVYGDVNYQITPQLQAGAGLRYTWDRKHFELSIPQTASSLGNIWTFPFYTDGFIEDTRTWQGLTPRVFLRYAPDPRLSLYASVTRGYKAGGFGSFTVDAPSAIPDYGLVPAGTRPDAFNPETVWSGEIGAKGLIWGRRLQFDVTAFHYIYRDLQTNYYDTATRTQQVVNVGRVRGYGVESAVTFRPNRYFDVYANLVWTRTVTSGDRACTLVDCGGLPNPTWASSGVATFHLPLAQNEFYAAGEWAYEGHRREAFDWRGITRRDAYTAVNLRLGYRSGERWDANFYVQNVLDSTYYLGAQNGGDLTPASVWGVSQPRNAGVQLRWRFGGR